nr:Glucose-1-phosphate adenylyltransferase [Candidatus Pantoea persica]
MGIYVFNADYLYQLLEEDLQEPASNHDFGKDILPKVVVSGEGYAHSFTLSCVQQDETSPPYWLARCGHAGGLLARQSRSRVGDAGAGYV